MDNRFLALAWEDENGPHLVQGNLQYIEVEEEEPAEFARWDFEPTPPIMVRPPMMRHTYVIDGKSYEFSWPQDHTIYLKQKEEKMAEYRYTDEDGDEFELEDDNTINVTGVHTREEISVFIREENFGPLVYHMLENHGTEISELMQDGDEDEATCRSMMMFYAKRLMDMQKEKDDKDEKLTDLAITLYSTFYGCSEDSARKVFDTSVDSRKKALGWARKLEEKTGQNPNILQYKDRSEANTFTIWKASNNRGYFVNKSNKWYFGDDPYGDLTPYADSLNFLSSYHFPMTAV